MYAYTTMDDYIIRTIWAAVFVGSVYSIWLAGRIAERRGRSFKVWARIAGLFIGPLAIPLLFLLPNLHRNDPEDPKGERRPAGVSGTAKPAIQSNPDRSHLDMSFAGRRNLAARMSMLRFTRLGNVFPGSSGAVAAL
jgi:MFS family permease